ncbi:MAG: DUF4270 domain-containing protein [Bacteroidia bacterium]|nr:DUF4270 domain-containing protein [Bacteroidia bacterium]
MYSSCKKDINTLKVGFINPDSSFNSNFESIFLNSFTTTMDSLATHQQSLYILGSINDPIFGKSQATILTSFSIPNNAATFSFGDSNKVKVDSVVLQLRIGNDTTYIGDANAIHNIKVYELNEKLSDTSVYFSNRNYVKSPIVIGTFNSKFSPKDSLKNTYLFSDARIPACIRIPLSDDFKLKIQNQYIFSQSSFYDLFKGFAIVDESNFGPSEGGFWYLNLNSIYTNVVVYYRNDTTHLRAEFPIQYANAKYNKYENNSSVLTQPNTIKFSANQQRDNGYLQAMGGTKLRLFIPDSVLNRLAASPQLAIQKAEIVVKALPGFDDDNFKIPNQITLVSTDSLAKSVLTIDSYTESFLYLGGTVNKGEYRFNIARELNFLLTNLRNGSGNKHYGLSIIVPNSTYASVFQTSARRVVLDSKDFKLKINYTIIK